MRAVSVAMATYNGERFLAEQLDSLARQTLAPAEVVICDDGSTDRTLEIARTFAGRLPLRIERNPDNLGYRANFLKAASLCASPIIAFCDQDDVWKPDKLERCVERMHQDNALLVMHAAAIVDESLKPYGRLERMVDGRTHEPLTLFPYAGEGFGLTMVFRKVLLDMVDSNHRPRQPHDPKHLLTHDTWCLVVASIFGRVATIDEDLVLYRQHGTNVSGADAVTNPQTPNLPHKIAEAHRARAAFSKQVAEAVTFANPARDVYEDLAASYDTRARVYDGPTLSDRLLALTTLLRRGDYQLSRKGRMGLPAMGRDVLVGVTRILADKDVAPTAYPGLRHPQADADLR